MKKGIVVIAMGVVALSLMLPFSTNVHAAMCDQLYQSEKVIPMSDVIVRKYRRKNGIFQYRHWNETKGCWVEDHWINL